MIAMAHSMKAGEIGSGTERRGRKSRIIIGSIEYPPYFLFFSTMNATAAAAASPIPINAGTIEGTLHSA